MSLKTRNIILAGVLFIRSALGLLNFFGYIDEFIEYGGFFVVLQSILIPALLVGYGVEILKQKYTKYSVIALGIYLVFDFSITTIALAILVFVPFFVEHPYAQFLRKLWFVPAAIYVITVFSLFEFLNVLGVIITLVSIAVFLVLGYYLKDLPSIKGINNVQANINKNNKLTYYQQLFEQGVITAEEYEKKRTEIINE